MELCVICPLLWSFIACMSVIYGVTSVGRVVVCILVFSLVYLVDLLLLYFQCMFQGKCLF